LHHRPQSTGNSIQSNRLNHLKAEGPTQIYPKYPYINIKEPKIELAWDDF
jgi:hypothetical protein